MTEILIIKPSSIGDIVHGLQVAQSIKDQAPDTRLTWVVRDRFAALVENCAAIDDILIFHRGRGLVSFSRLLVEIRRRRFDAVLDFQGLARTGIMTAVSRARRKIGRSDAREGAGLFYGERAPLPAAGEKAHAIDILLEFLPMLNLEAKIGTALSYNHASHPRFGQGFDGAGPVVLCPHSRRGEKEWPGFEELARRLRRDRPTETIVWSSHETRGDAPVTDDPGFIDLGGRTGLDQLITLITQARLVVSNDSGPMHIAAALRRPVVALFGPTSATRFGPYPPDAPSHHVIVAPGGDLRRLEVDTVLAEIERVLDR
ncbi:MAG: glycosyltransferase family 9 protein [Alphaproteobacteria bacterium]|nr:glycosyltransferase family 9 protein [Alphaproteobacteria bacterium]